MSRLLELHGLEKRFGARLLFRIEHWAIDKGEVYVLTGQNGTGKSTLLRILAGLEAASLDKTVFNGRDIALSPYPAFLRREIVYMHQHPVMFDTNVVANVGYGLAGSGLPDAERGERVEEAIAWAGIGHLRQRPATSLSGGEKQRVALARAWAVRPSLLLLDEPTASLDGAAREHVLQLIPALLDGGCSLVIASHERDLMNLPRARKIRLAHQRLSLQCDEEWLTA